ncbi:hypothetical protein OAG71_01040 [bacterium]|nr:hypothetical protein [bacterium]
MNKLLLKKDRTPEGEEAEYTFRFMRHLLKLGVIMERSAEMLAELKINTGLGDPSDAETDAIEYLDNYEGDI